MWFARSDLEEGYATVVDMKGVTLSHLPRVNLLALKKFMYYIQARPTINIR